MTDTDPRSGRPARYRFSRPGDEEIEMRELSGDDAAEVYARQLSASNQTPVIIQRHGIVDLEYITEVDERSS